MIQIFFALIAMVGAHAVVSAIEAALLSLPRNRAMLMASKSAVGKVVLSLKDHLEKPLTTTVSLTNFITVFGSIIVGVITERLLGNAWLAISAATLTLLILVFGELIPKRLGERYAEKIMTFVAAPLFAVSRLAAPMAWFIRVTTRPFSPAKRSVTSEEEIAFLARVGGQEGVIRREEAELISRAFRLNDITARDMMTPEAGVLFIDGAKKIGESVSIITSANHSRIPVFEGTHDTIVGVAHQRDLLKALTANEQDREVKEFARDALLVNESMLADQLLREFQEKRTHLAVVINVAGKVTGVVGLEDVLEELVGEIIDEKDVAPDLIKRLSKTEVLVHGETRISYLNHFFNTTVKSKKTVNKFLQEAFGRLPEAGAKTETMGLTWMVEAVGPKAIDRVRVVKPEGAV